jgi:hypothetical protein
VNDIKVGWARYDTIVPPTPPLLWSFLMATSIESGRSPSPNKENTSDIIPSLRGDDTEQNRAVHAKLLERATLKIDFYLIPIVGMFCVSFL